MEAEPERDLTRSADGSGIGLNNEFLVQKILHIEEHIRRLVHLTVAEDPAMSSESIGDAFLKTVIISKK